MSDRLPFELDRALERLPIAMYAADVGGTLLWMNEEARRLVGPSIGRSFSRVIAPEHLRETREQFARKVIGAADATRFRSALVSRTGRRIPVELASAPVRRGGRVVGVLGVASVREDVPEVEAACAKPQPELTPRTQEVLRLLADGKTTRDIASDLGIAHETARNHVRALLRSLGVKTRLEAVVAAFRNGWL